MKRRRESDACHNGPVVEINYERISKESRKKLQEAIHGWAVWQSDQLSSLSLSTDSLVENLESGTDIFIPSLLVRSQEEGSTPILPVWVDIPRKKKGRSTISSRHANETKTEPDLATPNSVDANELKTKADESNRKKSEISFNKKFDSSNEVPIFDRCLSTLKSQIGSPTEKATMETVILQSSSRCFNCGSYNHNLRECRKPRDATAIAAARGEHGSQRGNASVHVRYHQGSTQDSKNFDDLVPGKLAPETREALGLRELEAPPWIGRMRLMGCPPDYLNPGEVRKEEEERGIVFFDDVEIESGEVKGNPKAREVEEGELEEGELEDSPKGPLDTESLLLQKHSIGEGENETILPSERDTSYDGKFYQRTHHNISPNVRNHFSEEPILSWDKSSPNSRNWTNGNYNVSSKTNETSYDYRNTNRREERSNENVNTEGPRWDWEAKGKYVYHQNTWVFVENTTETSQNSPIPNYSHSPNSYNPHVTQQIPSPRTPNLPYPFQTPAPPIVTPPGDESFSWRHIPPSSRPSLAPFPPVHSLPLSVPLPLQDETINHMGCYSPILPPRPPPLPPLTLSPFPPPPPEEPPSPTPSPLPSSTPSPPLDEFSSPTPSPLPPPLPWLTSSPFPPPPPKELPSPTPPPEEPDMDLSP